MSNNNLEKLKVENDIRSEYLSLVEQDERIIKIIKQLEEQRIELNKQIKRKELLLKNCKKNK